MIRHRRSRIPFLVCLYLLCTHLGYGQELSQLGGIWTKVSAASQQNQPGIGSWLEFSLNDPSRVFFSWTTPGRIAETSGEYGSNYKILGDTFNCFYYIIVVGNRMTFTLKRGEPPNVCLEDGVFERRPKAVIQQGPVIQPPQPPVSRVQQCLAGPPGSPSFNCLEDRKPDDQAICRSTVLSCLDRYMDQLYFTVKSNNQQLLNQRDFIRRRRECLTNSNCIKNLYLWRISQLESIQ
jgi:hypothetical protein